MSCPPGSAKNTCTEMGGTAILPAFNKNEMCMQCGLYTENGSHDCPVVKPIWQMTRAEFAQYLQPLVQQEMTRMLAQGVPTGYREADRYHIDLAWMRNNLTALQKGKPLKAVSGAIVAAPWHRQHAALIGALQVGAKVPLFVLAEYPDIAEWYGIMVPDLQILRPPQPDSAYVVGEANRLSDDKEGLWTRVGMSAPSPNGKVTLYYSPQAQRHAGDAVLLEGDWLKSGPETLANYGGEVMAVEVDPEDLVAVAHSADEFWYFPRAGKPDLRIKHEPPAWSMPWAEWAAARQQVWFQEHLYIRVAWPAQKPIHRAHTAEKEKEKAQATHADTTWRVVRAMEQGGEIYRVEGRRQPALSDRPPLEYWQPEHRRQVEAALQAGLPVPDPVRLEYPELITQYGF